MRDQDKFMLRLPDGMRERIKAKADRAGMSMNEAIVWCLDRHFPAPATLDDKIGELAVLVAALRHGSDVEAKVDALIGELDEALRDIAQNKVKDTTRRFRQIVYDKVAEWDTEAIEQESDPFDDAYWSEGNPNPPFVDWDDREDPFPPPDEKT